MPLSKAPVPHFYVTVEVAMDRAWDLREELNALDGQPKLSVNDLVIKACALALRKNPGVNASLQGQAIRIHHRAHIGIAVALDQGLITPVLRDCDIKPLAQIAIESRDLAERARGGKLRVPEMSGATFSISNLGMFDVEEFSAIINPPEGAILAVGSVIEKPVVEGGQVRIGRRAKLTLSCDHRVMDGAMGAASSRTSSVSCRSLCVLLAMTAHPRSPLVTGGSTWPLRSSTSSSSGPAPADTCRPFGALSSVCTVAAVEDDRAGGVCLNWGCIPTKALLRNAEVVGLFQRAQEFGISIASFQADYAQASSARAGSPTGWPRASSSCFARTRSPSCRAPDAGGRGVVQ
jgi:hypothetical protein